MDEAWDAASAGPAEPPAADGAPGAPPRVRRLSDGVVNRIAAGEVVERPASVVKELVENALDAGARRIEVTTAAGGKTLIRVADDGIGMDRADLELAVCRHCTSKLVHEAFSAIRTLGFRGEALPSIGAVSRLSIETRARGANTAWRIEVDGGRTGPVRPAARPAGTLVEVRDLFHATPARLKFLKAERTEAGAVADVVRRLALAHPAVRFRLVQGERSVTEHRPAASLAERAASVLGAAFADDALPLEAAREGIALTGLLGTPAFTRPNGDQVHLFVNGRPVRDRALLGALKAGYQDVLPRDRHPVAVVHVAADPALVDVNVHPAKTEVRFRDAALVRALLVSAVRARLATAGQAGRPASLGALGAAAAPSPAAPAIAPGTRGFSAGFRPPPARPAPFFARSLPERNGLKEAAPAFEGMDAPSARAVTDAPDGAAKAHPLGAAVAQLHGNYIVAETQAGIVLVDAHAAHERIVYEKLKRLRETTGVPSQGLMVPEIVELPPEDAARLLAVADEIARFGLALEAFGPGAVAVRAVPAVTKDLDVRALVTDLAAEVDEGGHADRLERLLDRVAATLACYGSVRTGRRLTVEEMNALLRDIEETPNAGRCNHGRPTTVTLDLADVERLFMRR